MFVFTTNSGNSMEILNQERKLELLFIKPYTSKFKNIRKSNDTGYCDKRVNESNWVTLTISYYHSTWFSLSFITLRLSKNSPCFSVLQDILFGHLFILYPRQIKDDLLVGNHLWHVNFYSLHNLTNSLITSMTETE